MKRLVCILLILMLLLCGCQKEDTVVFYYCPVDPLSAPDNSLLKSEDRAVTGYTDNLFFLISLYLSGPLDTDLVSPFPIGTKLHHTTTQCPDITIQLQELPQTMSDSEFSLACACLSKTVMELTGAESVTVVCGNRTVTMYASSLLFSDQVTPNANTPGGKQ